MEILSLDLSLITISLVSAFVIIIVYFRYVKLYNFKNNDNKVIIVIDIVRALKKACPVQFSNKWKLLINSIGSTRSWQKSILLPGFKNYINLYGATCAVTCSSLSAFSLISDVSKWGEWEPSQSSQNVILKCFNSIELKRDHFMQADQIAGIQRGANVQSYVALYRFMNHSSSYMQWILFWNAKKFEFMFFLFQPVTSENVDNECVITHLYASSPQSSHYPDLVAQRIRNIKEYLSLSQLNVRPLVSVPLPQESSPCKKKLSDNEDSPSVLSERDIYDTTNSVFILVPIYYYFLFTYQKLKGYKLLTKKVAIKSKKMKKKNNQIKNSHIRQPMKRSVSELVIKRTDTDFYNNSSKQSLEKENNLSSHSVSNNAEVLNECSVFDNQNENKLQTIHPSLKLRSFSEPSVPDVVRTKTPSESFDLDSEKDNKRSLQSIDEIEESVENDIWGKEELGWSSTSEFELLGLSNQQYSDLMIAGYLTQGNYGASVLQTEIMLATQFDENLQLGNQVAGGWIYSSRFKGISVFTKAVNGKIMKIRSFLCQTEIPVNYKDVWECVKNPRFRFYSDETVKIVRIIDKISESQKLLHICHEASSVLKKQNIDFCLLQTEREEKDNFYSVFQSVESEKCPLMQSVIRGSLKPSGWTVQYLTPKTCRVTYLVQIFVNSPGSIFIQDLNFLVPQCLYNLKEYLRSRPN